MAKKKGIDWEKVQKLHQQGFKPTEIAKKLKCSTGTLYNNKDKWFIEPEEEREERGQLVAEAIQEAPIINATTDKEITEVKEFYKSTLKEIRGKITKILKVKDPEEDTFKELQILEKLIKIIKEARHIDYTVNDILTYKDLATLEVTVKKLELDSLRALKK